MRRGLPRVRPAAGGAHSAPATTCRRESRADSLGVGSASPCAKERRRGDCAARGTRTGLAPCPAAAAVDARAASAAAPAAGGAARGAGSPAATAPLSRWESCADSCPRRRARRTETAAARSPSPSSPRGSVPCRCSWSGTAPPPR